MIGFNIGQMELLSDHTIYIPYFNLSFSMAFFLLACFSAAISSAVSFFDWYLVMSDIPRVKQVLSSSSISL